MLILSLRAGVYTGVAIFIFDLREKIPTSLSLLGMTLNSLYFPKIQSICMLFIQLFAIIVGIDNMATFTLIFNGEIQSDKIHVIYFSWV